MAAACTHYLKNRDTRPVLVATLRGTDGAIYDLTGADSVTMHVYLHGGSDVISRPMVIDPDPTTGKARYTWVAGDWTGSPALESGAHRLEYEVLGPAPIRATFPNRDTPETRHELVVSGDIAQA
jgi:hypothetical protein